MSLDRVKFDNEAKDIILALLCHAERHELVDALQSVRGLAVEDWMIEQFRNDPVKRAIVNTAAAALHVALNNALEGRAAPEETPIFPGEVLQALLDWSGYEPSTSVLAQAVDKWTPELEEFMQWQIRRLAKSLPQEGSPRG